MEVIMETDRVVVDRIGRLGVLPVVELPSEEAALPLAEALSAGGLDAAEVTLRTPAALEAIRAMRSHHPDMLVGAGTVRSLEDAKRAAAAGAQFLVSPGTNFQVVSYAQEAGIPVVPGACTPTEIDAAVRAGAGTVKFFPAEAIGGVGLINALAGPFADVSLVPTGGIRATNLAEYLSLPNVLACGGTWIATRELLGEGRFDRIRELAREAFQIASETRNG
jgi:2-dehydro-3-deoxyphosphogluconate aldolase/(4S)-4-hydroxy-2-oxoglutarate aldolase